MKEDQNFSKACKEVLEILKNTEEEDFNKIPQDFLNNLEENADQNYKTNIDLSKEFEEQELLPETIDLLAYIYRKYWCSKEEKEEFDTIMKKNDIEYQNEMAEKYDINKKLKKKEYVKNEETLIVETEKDNSFLKKVFEYIKSFFKKR